MEFIPFNRPYLVGTETAYIEGAVADGNLSSGGAFADRCQEWLRTSTGSPQALLTHSGTGALEAAALLGGFDPGDEVIMPSFTFVTTATAFALRGVIPVFVEVHADTLTIDPERVADAITPRTKAVVPVHYAGVGCDMDEIVAVAAQRNLRVIEDAAQGLLATYRDRPLGGLGDLAAISFHETKNVTCGEGGALLVNDPDLCERAEIVCEKGTDRRRFERGEVGRYTWVDLGSSFGASELTAAFLWAQLERAVQITARRLEIWNRYHEAFADLEGDGLLRRPVIPADRTHNGHMYYVLLPDSEARSRFIALMVERQILTVFHYIPLHSSPAGGRFGRPHGDLSVTEDVAGRLVRLPLWTAMSDSDVDRVIASAQESVIAATG